MAKTTKTNSVETVTKTARASRKKSAPLHETHGALEPKPGMNMAKAFGIRDGYTADNLEAYKAEIAGMTLTDLHDHAHLVGVVPLDPRDKLIASLERQYVQAQMNQRPPKVIKVQTNPAMADFMKKWWAGEPVSNR